MKPSSFLSVDILRLVLQGWLAELKTIIKTLSGGCDFSELVSEDGQILADDDAKVLTPGFGVCLSLSQISHSKSPNKLLAAVEKAVVKDTSVLFDIKTGDGNTKSVAVSKVVKYSNYLEFRTKGK